MGILGPFQLPDYKEVLQWFQERPDWCADARCIACGFAWEVRVQDWIRCPNPPHRVGDLKARLKCERCGGGVSNLAPRPDLRHRVDQQMSKGES